MLTRNRPKENLIRPIKIAVLPLVIYSVFIWIRLKGIQPEAESELGDYITSVNFIAGGSLAYLMHVFMTLGYLSSTKKMDHAFWVLLSFMLFFLAFDEVFMIHEVVASMADIRDSLPLVIYGLFLIVILAMAYRYYVKPFYLFIVLFGFCSVVSIASDMLWGEGTIAVLGRSVSYEQFAESFGAFFLTCAVVCLMISFFRKNSFMFDSSS